MKLALNVYMLMTVLALTIAAFRWLNRSQPIPVIKTDTCYGPGSGMFRHSDNPEIRPFHISVQPILITHLKDILYKSATQRGGIMTRSDMRSFVSYWRGKYLSKWKTQEKYLNKFKQFKTEINGLTIHFIHEKSIEKDTDFEHSFHVPLLLLHGWPGTIREFYDVIAKLLEFSKKNFIKFHIVVPSLVGHGFSSAPFKPGFGTYDMAIVLRNLMLRLGYQRFMVHGGIWSSFIGRQMATIFPENVMAFHTDLCFIKDPLTRLKSVIASIFPDTFYDQKFVCLHFTCGRGQIYSYTETNYDVYLKFFKVDVVGMRISTDPLLLAQYILEKMKVTADDLLKGVMPIDAVLDNIMVYYLTNSILTGMQYHAESISKKQVSLPYNNMVSHVPMGYMQFHRNLPPVNDKALREKFPRLIHKSVFRKDVRYPAIQVPNDLFEDLVIFSRKIFF